MSNYLSKDGLDGFVIKKEGIVGYVPINMRKKEMIEETKSILKDKFIEEFTEKLEDLSKTNFEIGDELRDYFSFYEHERVRYYYEKLGAEDFFDSIIEIYKRNGIIRKSFKSFTLYSFDNWIEMVPINELFKFLLKKIEYDISKLKVSVEEFLSNKEEIYEYTFLPGQTDYLSSIVSNNSFCITPFYEEFFEMHASRYLEFDFKCFESFILDFVDMVKPVARNRCAYSDVSVLITAFRNLLAEFIVVSKKSSLIYILKFLETFQIEDYVEMKSGEKRYVNSSGKHLIGPKSSIYRKNLLKPKTTDKYDSRWSGGFTYLDDSPELTLFGQNVFYRVKEALENLSVEEKRELINQKWWIDNGYREVAGNALSYEIKKYYIEPAIYGTPVPVDERISETLNKYNDKIQKAFDSGYLNAIDVLAKLPLISIEAGTDEDREIILRLMEIVYNHFGDDAEKYKNFLIFNQKWLESNINLIAWIEKCKNFEKIKQETYEKRKVKK